MKPYLEIYITEVDNGWMIESSTKGHNKSNSITEVVQEPGTLEVLQKISKIARHFISHYHANKTTDR